MLVSITRAVIIAINVGFNGQDCHNSHIDFDSQGSHNSNVGFDGQYGHNSHNGLNGQNSHNGYDKKLCSIWLVRPMQ